MCGCVGVLRCMGHGEVLIGAIAYTTFVELYECKINNAQEFSMPKISD